MKPSRYIWQNGNLVEWDNAQTHVLSHGLHYGTGYFEGIRAYETPKGPAIFRHREHMERLIDSARIHLVNIPLTVEELMDATRLLIQKNQLKSCYIRPLSYLGYGKLGLHPQDNPVETIIAAWEWGTYLGDEGIENGIRCTVSSWARIDSRSLPAASKCTANYANSILAKREAIANGFDEAIMLNTAGTIAEGPGENLFLIKNNHIVTPPSADSVLGGITAKTAIELLESFGYTVEHRRLTRDELFTADELFFTGTAAEITPIREIDGRVIGNGSRGTITEKVQTAYFNIVHGVNSKYSHYLDQITL